MNTGHYYQLTPFGRGIKALIDSGDLDTVRDVCMTPNMYDDFTTLSVSDKHALVHDILTNMPLRISDEKRMVYQDVVTFLMLSIPYEPLVSDEMIVADRFGKSLRNSIVDSHLCMDEALNFLRRRQVDYAVHYRLEQTTQLSMISLRPEASEANQRYHRTFSALYISNNATDYGLKREWEASTHLYPKSAIVISREAMKGQSFDRYIKAVMHEVRHAHQAERPTPIIRQELQHGIASRLTKYMSDVYFTSMMERQAYAFDSWLYDSMRGQEMKDELHVTLNNLLNYKGATFDILESVLKYHVHVKNMYCAQKPDVSKSPRITGHKDQQLVCSLA